MACFQRILILLLLVPGGSMVAGEGVVRTRDGKVYAGSVRLDKDRLIVVDADRGRVVPVASTNLWHAFFDGGDGLERDRSPVGVGMSGGVPGGWERTVTGAGEGRSRVEVSDGLFRMRALGAGMSAREDRGHFLYQPVEGNREILVRVLSVGGGELGGVMMRASLEPHAPHVFLGVRGGRGGLLRWRERPEWEMQVEEQRAMFVPYWLRLKRVGDTFTAYRSSRGRHWKLINRVTIPMGETYYVGLAGGAERSSHGRLEAGGWSEAAFDQVREGKSLSISGYVPRVTLRSGSVVAGVMESREGTIQFPGPEIKPEIPVFNVAALNFQYLPRSMSRKVDQGRPGVLLLNGEFIDGRLHGIRDGLVTVSSVLFGLRTYDLNNEIRAVVLRNPAVSAASYEVLTMDGSHWLASRLEVRENEVVIWEPLLGRVSIPVYRLLEIRRSARAG